MATGKEGAPIAVVVSPAQPTNPLVQYGGLTAAAAVIAATIAALVAVWNIRANRKNLEDQLKLQQLLAAKTSWANVVSSNRQLWVNALRDDLATFMTSDAEMLTVKARYAEAGEGSAEEAQATVRLHEIIRERRLMLNRIRLRLNPKKPKHIELLDAVKAVMPAEGEQHGVKMERLTVLAQELMRGEWERIKEEARGSGFPDISLTEEEQAAAKQNRRL